MIPNNCTNDKKKFNSDSKPKSNRTQYNQQNKNNKNIKPTVEQYNNQHTINDNIPLKSSNPKRFTTVNLDSYFVR